MQNDCFADDAVEEAKETDTSLSLASIKATALQLAVCRLYRSARKQLRRTATTHSKTGTNSGWIRHGNQLRQEQNSRQQHQAKIIYQMFGSQIIDNRSTDSEKVYSFWDCNSRALFSLLPPVRHFCSSTAKMWLKSTYYADDWFWFSRKLPLLLAVSKFNRS